MIARAFFFTFFYCFTAISLAAVNSELLSSETYERYERVPEFNFIIQEAEKLGVKVYLFGGTASAFAHYVRWDLEREAGDLKYQPERFDYDFTNIYRGNQDLDIVVDGTQAQAEQLREVLRQAYPHFMGDREAWEVRLLRADMGDKKPLLDDYDFKNQHTDTNSTGLLALNPSEGEIVYRDLLDWDNTESEFLTDVAAAKIKFIYNEKHETTSRFKDGKNPPILAAIRYLAKLTQYEVEGTNQDLEIIKKIISQTEANEFTPYVKRKAFEFGLKALLNAPDVEYAWNLLDDTGARKLLMNVDGNRTDILESLSWWFNKEPLRSFEIGEGSGKTASEIFKTKEITVAHETRSFIAYENIIRSAKGRANVFISRKGIFGESAAYGDGFYTRLGMQGARGTNLTIRFKLHPDAIEGEDFIFNDDFIVVTNKNVLTLIQEKLDINVLDFFKLLLSNSIKSTELGLLEKLKRKFKRFFMSENSMQEVKSYLKNYVTIADDFPKEVQFDFSLIENSTSFEELYNIAINSIPNYYESVLPEHIREKKLSSVQRNWIENLMSTNKLTHLVTVQFLSEEQWSKFPNLIEEIIKKVSYPKKRLIIKNVLSKSHWKQHEHIIENLIKNKKLHSSLISFIFSQEIWSNRIDLVKQMMLDNPNYSNFLLIIREILLNERLGFHPELVEIILKHKNHFNLSLYLVRVLASEPWSAYPHFLKQIIDHPEAQHHIIEEILPLPYWKKSAQPILEEFIENCLKEGKNIIKILAYSHWNDQTYLLDAFIEENKFENDKYALEKLFTLPLWTHRDDLMEIIIKRGKMPSLIANVLGTDLWIRNERVIRIFAQKEFFFNYLPILTHKEAPLYYADLVEELANDKRVNLSELIKNTLNHEQWSIHPGLIITMMNSPRISPQYIQETIQLPHWKNHPILKKFIGLNQVTYGHLKVALGKENFKEWLSQQPLSCSLIL